MCKKKSERIGLAVPTQTLRVTYVSGHFLLPLRCLQALGTYLETHTGRPSSQPIFSPFLLR